jgi:hypothetical protein
MKRAAIFLGMLPIYLGCWITFAVLFAVYATWTIIRMAFRGLK